MYILVTGKSLLAANRLRQFTAHAQWVRRKLRIKVRNFRYIHETALYIGWFKRIAPPIHYSFLPCPILEYSRHDLLLKLSLLSLSAAHFFKPFVHQPSSGWRYVPIVTTDAVRFVPLTIPFNTPSACFTRCFFGRSLSTPSINVSMHSFAHS